jgi:hypothetical protein
MGIQMVGDTKKAIFSIWDVDSNPGSAQPAWPSCGGRFGWEGNGTRCIIIGVAYPFLPQVTPSLP